MGSDKKGQAGQETKLTELTGLRDGELTEKQPIQGRRANQINKGMWKTICLEYREDQTFLTEVMVLPGNRGVIQRDSVYNGKNVAAMSVVYIPNIAVRPALKGNEESLTYNAGTMNNAPGLGRKINGNR